MKGNAFSRSMAMAAAIAAAMQAGSKWDIQQALAAIGPYESRGKGKGKSAKWLGGSTRSKYMPHIGAKEQERAKRCYMSPTFNCDGHLRAAPVMHQIGKPSKQVHVYAIEECESVF